MSQSFSATRALIFSLAVFTSAFLLFQVQPILGKYVLPWFGGTPAVWTTCMLFFQSLLFGGYLYAHALATWCPVKLQPMIHAGLLIAAACLLPIIPDAQLIDQSSEQPTLQVLLVLAVAVGLPYFMLSSTGPLLQKWFTVSSGGQSPYRLYALSNVGSLLALISYPFVVEPALPTQTQAVSWSWGFGLFVLLTAACGVVLIRSHADAQETDSPEEQTASPTATQRLLWFSLAMCASVMLLAITNQITTDVAVVPFLWVIPLTLYLLSFIFCFDSDRWYRRSIFTPLLVVSFAATTTVLFAGAKASLTWQLASYLACLFVSCMVCHGELVRIKPHPRYLTGFYLTISAGGAAGGLAVGLLAPVIFSLYVELHIAIVACCILYLTVLYIDEQSILHRGKLAPVWVACGLGVSVLAYSLYQQQAQVSAGAIALERNFYGVLRIGAMRSELPDEDGGFSEQIFMQHGRTRHGLQFMIEDKRELPTMYYARHSGVGLALNHLKTTPYRHIGVVGLGVGTLAAYASEGDRFRMYEINPEVTRLAKSHFTYLRKCKGEVTHVLGDARISLEAEEPQQFDVLVLDAFSSDSIPTHLLTREAFEIYLKHLKPDGIIAAHITNNYLNIDPVISGIIEEFSLHDRVVEAMPYPAIGATASRWVIAARDDDQLKRFDSLAIRGAAIARLNSDRLLWTDNWSNLFEIVRWKRDEKSSSQGDHLTARP